MNTSHILVTPRDDLQLCLNKARPGDIIQLSPGEYRTKCILSVPDVTIRGSGMDKTRIVWDDYAEKMHEDGKAYNTFRTWTMAVCADHVTMENLSIVNDALSPEIKGQEVALSVYADDFNMRHCRLTSTQDTLFLGPLPKDLIERYDGFLPDDLSDKELNEIMRRSGIENPTSEESIKFLMLAYFEHEKKWELKGVANDLDELNSAKKKAFGRRFIDAVKAHPVLGRVEKGNYPSEKLCVIGNIAWYGKLFHELLEPAFTANVQRTKLYKTTEGYKDIMNSKIGDYMFLSDRGLKLSQRWRNRGGRNISTKDNPYGIDMGDAFMAGYTDQEFEPKSGSVPQCNKKGIKTFLSDMNWIGILQSYHMTMERVLSAKTELQQRAYLKLMVENHMLTEQFGQYSKYKDMERDHPDRLGAELALRGTYIRASLDVDNNNPYCLPEKYGYFSELSDEDWNALWASVKKISQHMEEVTGRRVVMKVVGTDVPHAHVHLMPLDETWEYGRTLQLKEDEFKSIRDKLAF